MTELTVWDYLNDVYFQKNDKLNLEKINEVNEKQKNIVDKKIKKNKERINIPNATIKYYNYRYEQDSERIQQQNESEALKTGKNNTKRQRQNAEQYTETRDFIIQEIE